MLNALSKCTLLSAVTWSLLQMPLAHAEGGIGFDKTRAVINPGKTETALVLANDGDWAFLIQNNLESVDKTKVSGITVTPPLARLLPKQSMRVRMVVTDPTALPQDRETVVWLVSQSIPANTDAENVMRINYINRIKVFYRPATLQGKRLIDAMAKLKVSREGNKVVLHNDSPFVLSMGSYQVNEKTVDTSDMILPFSTFTPAKVDLPSGGVKFGWNAIDEYGAYRHNETNI